MDLSRRPTPDAVDECFVALVEGRTTRDEADRWAARWVADDEFTCDDVSWWALTILHGIDLPASGSGSYLFSDEQVRAWLAQRQRGLARCDDLLAICLVCGVGRPARSITSGPEGGTLSHVMRLVRQESFGGPEVLRMVEAERPAPIGTEVLVRVHAAGVNPVDWKTRSGDGLLRTLPLTVGWDVCGVVEADGLGVTRFEVGDEVFGMPWFPREAGAYAEYVTGPSRQFARRPEGMSHVQAAGLPLAGLTAWQVLVDTAAVRAGQRVLVTAAAGGVGHLAVQIAKARGAYVIGTAREEKHGFVRGLGADEVIDYTRTDPADAVGDLDIVFDPVGAADDACDWVPAIKPGGLLVSFGAHDDQALLSAAAQRSVRTALVLVEPDGHGLEALADLVDTGDLRVEIDTTLPLDQAAKAHAIGERGRTRGKIVLTV